MPLPIAHGLPGARLGVLLQAQSGRNYLRPLLIGAAVANAADFDFLLVLLLGSKGMASRLFPFDRLRARPGPGDVVGWRVEKY